MTDATRDTRAIGNVHATKQQIRLASLLSMTMARIAAIDYDDKQPMNVKSMASCVPRMWHTYQTWPGTVHLIQYQTDLQKNCDQYMFWSWYVCSLTSISTLSLWLWECSYGDEYFASSVYPLIDAWLWLWHLVWTTTSLPLTIMSRLPSEWYGHEGMFAVC